MGPILADDAFNSIEAAIGSEYQFNKGALVRQPALSAAPL
jgi:hypothetical protein